ncbi:hypothetical protein TNCV_2440201 [Trichonephila clavipes]|nr:hypothetical protein TNCV_2440201 [Trichonephila clavipes]
MRCHLHDKRGSGRPSTDQSSRNRHSIRNGHVQTAALSGAIQAKVATSLLLSEPTKVPGLKHTFGKKTPLRFPPLTPAHRRLHLEWCRPRGMDCSRMETGRLQRRIRFNLCSDDNRARVETPWWTPQSCLLLYNYNVLIMRSGLR